MRKRFITRLLALAAFIEKIPVQKFDFSTIAELGEKPMLEALKAGAHRCGTVACAIGWMPALFPRTFRWTDEDFGYISVVNRKTGATDFKAAESYFGLSTGEGDYLFAPRGSYYDDGGGYYYNNLGENSSPKAVAKNIRKFVARKQKEAKKPKKKVA